MDLAIPYGYLDLWNYSSFV